MILSESHLKIIDQHSENKGIKYVTLILTLLGCLSQLYHHTVEYVEKDVIRELNKIPVQAFDLPDQTLCFQFVYLINLARLKKVKPVVLREVERHFKIRLSEPMYFRLIRENNTFKEFFIRKLDEHVTYDEFHEVLLKKSQIFERIVVAYNDKIGDLQTFELHQYCLIKKLIKTFYACYTFTCSRQKLRDHFDNRTHILDDEPQSEFIMNETTNFQPFRIKQRYLLSFMGKNIVFKIMLNKDTFRKNGLRSFRVSLHEANTFPRHVESLIHVQPIRRDGFRQLYTYTFLHVKRLKAPYKSNCTQRIEYRIRRQCEDERSKELFNSLLFGNYYSREPKYDNLSLGLNQQYFFYKYNRAALENISVDCSIRTSQDQCDEYIYYIFTNLALPSEKMILQLMVPINANYLCEDRPKLNLSEYLLKSLSIINFWFGFTIIQCMFNLHDDVTVLYKQTVVADDQDRDQEYLVANGDHKESDKEERAHPDKLAISNYQPDIAYQFDQSGLRNRVKRKSGIFNKLFRSNKSDDNDYLVNAYLENLARNRAILYRNLQLNSWIYNPDLYNPLTASGKLAKNSALQLYRKNEPANKAIDLNALVSRAIKGKEALIDEGSADRELKGEPKGELGRTNRIRPEERITGKLENKLSEKPGDKLGSAEIRNQPTDQSNADQLTNDNLQSNALDFEAKDEPRAVRLFNDASHKHSSPDEFHLRTPERLRAQNGAVDRHSGQLADRANEEPIKNLVISKWSVIRKNLKQFLFPPRPGPKRQAPNRNVIYHSPISKPSAM